MNSKALIKTGCFSAAIFLAGCTTVISDNPEKPRIPVSPKAAQQPALSEPVGNSEVTISPAERADAAADVDAPPAAEQPVVTLEIPKPENQLADREYHWSQLLSRDSILPIYNPEFVSASDAPYDNDELVIGVALNGEAKAYAIGPLNRREMVNDTLAGIPILVTW